MSSAWKSCAASAYRPAPATHPKRSQAATKLRQMPRAVRFGFCQPTRCRMGVCTSVTAATPPSGWHFYEPIGLESRVRLWGCFNASDPGSRGCVPDPAARVQGRLGVRPSVCRRTSPAGAPRSGWHAPGPSWTTGASTAAELTSAPTSGRDP